jgi:hypothetical protein
MRSKSKEGLSKERFLIKNPMDSVNLLMIKVEFTRATGKTAFRMVLARLLTKMETIMRVNLLMVRERARANTSARTMYIWGSGKREK